MLVSPTLPVDSLRDNNAWARSELIGSLGFTIIAETLPDQHRRYRF